MKSKINQQTKNVHQSSVNSLWKLTMNTQDEYSPMTKFCQNGILLSKVVKIMQQILGLKISKLRTDITSFNHLSNFLLQWLLSKTVCCDVIAHRNCILLLILQGAPQVLLVDPILILNKSSQLLLKI